MSLLTRAAATLAASAVVLAPSALVLSPAHADASTTPRNDPFYRYDAGNPTAPAGTQHGDVIDSRTVNTTLTDVMSLLSGSGKTFPATATQLLYRTQNEQGDPSQTVTTVIKPAGVSRGVVAYLSFYDGLGDTCDPSYTLHTGSVGQEDAVIGTLLESGYTVTVPDFEGETLDWAAGHEAGWATLDAVKATETKLGLPAATTPVGLMGYSGGSIAGDWASELAHDYAPQLDLVGTAIGGVPAKLDDVMRYVDGSADPDQDGTADPVDSVRDQWVGVVPAAMVSLGRANGVNLSSEYGSSTPTYPEVSPTKSGQQIAAEVEDQCIDGFRKAYPGLHVADLLRPGVDFLNAPDVKPIIDYNEMGTGGTPTMPMLIVQGTIKDDSGDGVMFAADVKKLADLYTSKGVPVTYQPLAGQDHTAAGQSFILSALGFLARLMPVPPAAHKPTPSVDYVRPTLHGHSKGHRDVLVVKAKGAAGAKVKLFRAGHHKAIGHDKVNKHGKATIKVHDRNGSAKTRYHAVVKATATTKRATTKKVALR